MGIGVRHKTLLAAKRGKISRRKTTLIYLQHPVIEGPSGSLRPVKQSSASQAVPRIPRKTTLALSAQCRQTTLNDAFEVVTPGDRQRALRKDFDKQRRVQAKRRKQAERDATAATQNGRERLYKHDQTFGLHTQNVRGFGATHAAHQAWVSSLGEDTQHGRRDVVFLQETHVEDAHIGKAIRDHASRWGFRTGEGCPQLSFWGAADGRCGGTGILINPYGSITDPMPLWEESWSSRLVAITASLAGQRFVMVNVYAPVDRDQRERFYEDLLLLQIPSGLPVLMGGDFNCTLRPSLDRTYCSRTGTHDSPALRNLVRRWALSDCLQAAMPDPTDSGRVDAFHRTYHSYHYTIGGRVATSRIDRWYGTALVQQWVASTEMVPTVLSDHDGVLLHLRSPANPVRVKKPPRVYPVPPYAAKSVDAAVHGSLDAFTDWLDDANPSAEATALAWDSLKLRITTDCKRCKRQARRRGVNTYRQKRRRLYKQLAAAERVGCQRLDPVETITAQLDGLSLNPPEGLTNAQRVRRRIAELQADRAAYKTTRLFREHTWHEGRSPRNLFSRVSTKFANNTVPALVPGPGLPVRDIHDKADTFADAWAPIFCKDPPAESSIHELLSLLDPPPCADNLNDLAKPITEEEVAAAIKACKPGKACGPDRLCNDWYRDFAEALTPLLTRLFNQWYDNGVFPASFLEADIFCLKKGGDQSNPLNYRPLALLNSDYKLFTRVLATRTSPTLASIIHPNQAGFVPGRQLHDTVDLYSAAKVTAESDPSQQDALAMLLDFAKAYDSLARLFLMMVLAWLGYPAKFIKTLDFLHSGTTIRFLVNGLKSRPVAVTCGIRQGCPLAPLLFILALEPFYRLIELAVGISGVCLATACTSVILKVAGYADDTAVYLGSPAEVPSLLDISARFGAASGLWVNAGKTVIIALCSSVPTAEIVLPSPLAIHEKTEYCRYLGAQIGGQEIVSFTWLKAAGQLTFRLRLASLKTLTQDQRSTLAAAIIIPKLLHIARHAWPTLYWVGELQSRIRNFVWHGRFVPSGTNGSHWINTDIAALPRASGGLAVPDLKAELLAFAATEVTRWALTSNTTMRAVGDILFAGEAGPCSRPIYLTLGHRERGVSGLHFPDSIWSAGKIMLQVAGADILDMPPSGMASSMNALAVSTLPCSTAEWNEGGCMIDTSCLKGHATAALRDWCRTTRGVVCLEWLPYLSLSTLQLYDSNGAQVDVRTTLPLLAAPDTIIGDVLNWSHINSDHLAFQALCGGIPVSKISSSRAAQLSRLIALLICNFPSIVYATACHLEMRMLSPQQDHPHILTPPSHASPTHALLTTVGSSSSYPLLAFSPPGLLAEVHRATGSTARITGIHPHPTIARLGCLWVGHRRWKRDRKHYKAVAAAVSREKGKVSLQQRALDWALEAPCAHRTLERLQWTDIRRIVGISSWGERLLYRIKVRGLNLFQRTSGRRSCPHEGCSTSTTTLTHVFWECPAAGHLWGYFFGGWQALGHHGDLQVPASLLQFYLSVVPPGFYSRLDQEFSWYQLHARNEVAQHIPDVVAKCWKIGLATVVEVIWKWRCEYLDCDPHPSARRFQAALAVRLRQAYRTVAASFHEIGGSGPATTAARLAANALNANYSTLPFPLSSADSVFVLFFDGGSRGNPGPGGSGTVILQVERGAELGHPIWIASMAYGDKRTTNNTAEYRGLLHGLKHAKRAGLRPLHVVGDSQMIINQMDRRRPPRVGHLARLYWQCRNLADECGVTTWIHHYRSFNKTADALANLAMDTKVSRQMGGDATGIPPGCWDASLRHTQMDLTEWQTRVEVLSQRTLRTGHP